MWTGIALLVFVQGAALAACGDRRLAGSPMTSPSPPAAPPPTAPPRNDVAGWVLDTADRPVAGARVEVVDGPQAGTSAMSDATGQFSLAGTTFRATKEGYVSVTQASQTSAPGGRPWIIFHLEGLAPPVNIAGDYTLTFIADSACTELPNELQTRTYAATVTPAASRPNTSFDVTVTGAPLLGDYTIFMIGVFGDYLAFNLDWEGPVLVEQVAPNTYLAFQGAAEASVATSGLSTISASFDGTIEYCVLTSEMGRFYSCSPGQAVTYARCASKNHRLILTRR